ncbi:MAG: formate dehydrogenase subunit alpha [Dehalococcoidia bacterium]
MAIAELNLMLRLSLDGLSVEVPEGASVLDAINAAGIYIPQLCKDPDGPILGACRTCLVKIEGSRGFPASCSTPVTEGMRITTSAPDLDRIRRGVLELTAGMNPEGDVREGHGDLSTALKHYGIGCVEPNPAKRTNRDESNPFFLLNMADCILCGRCAMACDDIQHIGAIAMLGRAQDVRPGPFMDVPLIESICTSCGQCVASCPTGALRPKAEPRPIERETKTTCPYCGVGCGISLQTGSDNEILGVADMPDNRSSVGMLCVKGRFGTTFVTDPERLQQPLVRKHGVLMPVSWDEALDTVAEGFAKHRGAFASFASAKATNEDGYVLQKFVRRVMGTNNIDHCTRLCHSPSVEAMLRSVGSGATSNSYSDYEAAGCLFLVGCDPSSNHPVIASRMRRGIDDHGAKLIVANPKRIEMVDYATIWLQQRPGTDVALFNGLAQVILEEDLADLQFVRGRTEGFDEWRESIREYTPENVERITAVPADDLRRAARLYARPPHAGSCLVWGMGVTQHTNGTANAYALLNMALVAGQMGFPGSGISPLRGQNNVQGCGDAGCIPDSLPGYQSYRPEAVARFAEHWGGELPTEIGVRASEVFEEAYHGRVRAMYIVGENPLLSEPNLNHIVDGVEALDFLVVQDIFPHETTEKAHVVLPATSFAEKDGTFTNSERRVQRVRQAIPPIGESRPDWWITCELARRTLRRLGLPENGFDYSHPSEIFDEMASLTPILSGITYERLEEEGGIQWPCPTADHPGTPYLYGESFPIGKAKFFPVQQTEAAAELPDARYPLILNTGRVLYHWHGGTITRHAAGLLERYPDLRISVHPNDATRYGIEDGEEVIVASRRGKLSARALLTDGQREGEVFVPFVRLAESSANFLTNDALDPDARIPEYKVCAVRLWKANAGRGTRDAGRGSRGRAVRGLGRGFGSSRDEGEVVASGQKLTRRSEPES